jgi:hypothetical protein
MIYHPTIILKQVQKHNRHGAAPGAEVYQCSTSGKKATTMPVTALPN